MRRSPLIVPLAMVAMVAGACVAPPSETVVGSGFHPAEISQFAPVTYYYDGTAGEALNVVFSTESCAMSGTPCPTMTITGPGGQHVTTSQASGTWTLPTTGRYKLVFELDAGLFSVLTLNVWLSNDIEGGPISPGTYPFTTLLKGQRIVYTYAGLAGQVLHLSTTCFNMTFKVFDPNGVDIAPYFIAPLDIVLPADGDYRVSLGNCNQAQSTFTLAID